CVIALEGCRFWLPHVIYVLNKCGDMYTTSCTYLGLKNKINLGGVAPRKQKISYVHSWYLFALKT
ncbi:hypothetical protein, partial [Turicimonas muris]|uniref:hypothetical protein n=1 Tax=Turicimonas muris TaxID=1796652 RepID=UPI002634646A